MKTLIVYASSHGFTEECIEKLKEDLNDTPTVVNLKKTRRVENLASYDTVIVGGSIHAGHMQKKVLTFFKDEEETLTNVKNIGLFVVCMSPEKEAMKYIDEWYPQALREKAFAKAYFGGAFNFERMNFLQRFIIKNMMKKAEVSVRNIQEENIKSFARAINSLS